MWVKINGQYFELSAESVVALSPHGTSTTGHDVNAAPSTS